MLHITASASCFIWVSISNLIRDKHHKSAAYMITLLVAACATKVHKTTLWCSASLGPAYCLLWWNYSTNSLMKNILSSIHSLWVQCENARSEYVNLLSFLFLGAITQWEVLSFIKFRISLASSHCVCLSCTLIQNEISMMGWIAIKYSFKHSLYPEEESKLFCRYPYITYSANNRSTFPLGQFRSHDRQWWNKHSDILLSKSGNTTV